MKFKPTHRITFTPEEGEPTTCDVMLEDGAAYTEEEWYAYDMSDWELVDGEWLFRGDPTPGTRPGTVTVQKL
jgi:hypothetical protein